MIMMMLKHKWHLQMPTDLLYSAGKLQPSTVYLNHSFSAFFK